MMHEHSWHGGRLPVLDQLAGRFVAFLVVGLLACGVAAAQHQSGFEPPEYTGSPGGVDLNGQQGYYNPDPTNSVSFKVYTYAGNALGLPSNPNGGEQFVGGTGPGGSIYARSQKDVPYGSGTGIWTVAYDIASTFTGQLPTADNLGSWSTQPLADPFNPTIAAFIALARWTDPSTATNWNADYLYYDAGGNWTIGQVPDPGFQGLLTDHWYRWYTTFDFDTNEIIEVAIEDLTTGDTVTHNPIEWYLGGGAAGGLPAPSGFRFFAGTSDPAGNTLAFDNLSIIPEPAGLSLLAAAGLLVLRRRG